MRVNQSVLPIHQSQSIEYAYRKALETSREIGYTKGVIIRTANSSATLFLLSKSNTAIIDFARFVRTLKSVENLAVRLTNRAFFIGPYKTKKHPSQGGNPRVFLKGKSI